MVLLGATDNQVPQDPALPLRQRLHAPALTDMQRREKSPTPLRAPAPHAHHQVEDLRFLRAGIIKRLSERDRSGDEVTFDGGLSQSDAVRFVKGGESLLESARRRGCQDGHDRPPIPQTSRHSDTTGICTTSVGSIRSNKPPGVRMLF